MATFVTGNSQNRHSLAKRATRHSEVSHDEFYSVVYFVSRLLASGLVGPVLLPHRMAHLPPVPFGRYRGDWGLRCTGDHDQSSL